ncbi:trascription factor [Stagonosporopsis vannaccii]|nr:trascription factor [Stagonosporopsis vannaccii]
MRIQKDGRASTSCTECQRRKQKASAAICSREWPCDHCQARKVAHLCQFVVKRLQHDSRQGCARDSFEGKIGQKRSPLSPLDEASTPALLLAHGNVHGEDSLKAWGYMPGHVLWKVGAIEDISPRLESSLKSTGADVVEQVIHTLPPRSITDALVNHFLSVVNHRYNAIYAPTFTEQYVRWWADRTTGKRLNPEFTCLLLRVCAYSVQYLTPSLKKMIEFELACSIQQLTDRLSDAAEQLGHSFTASKTCTARVQEQFLKCAWLKSESKIIESWHALSCTIREAQELGIDRDANTEGLSEFDIEIRRRLWALLYIWDWQMGSWLGRPNLIDRKNLNFKLPKLRLDQPSSDPNILSPFAHMALQADLGRRLNTILSGGQSVDALSPNEILIIEAELDRFVDDLPPVFRLHDPDTSFDIDHPYFVFQRHQLHTVLYVTKLDFLKPFLTRTREDMKSHREDQLRAIGIDLALDALKVAGRLFHLEFPMHAKFHMVVFSIFDTSTILCSAIIHDHESRLPRQDEIFAAIERSLDMLHQLSLTTMLGASSYAFLYKLVQTHPKLSLRDRNVKRSKRRAQDSTCMPEPQTLLYDASPQESIPGFTSQPPRAPDSTNGSSQAPEVAEPAHTTTTWNDPCFDVDQFLVQHPLGSAAALNMSGMEQIWNWENLNLDQFPC